MSRTRKASTKKNTKKPKEPRNLEAIKAHFRKAGVVKDKRKKREDDAGKLQKSHDEEWE